MPAFAKLSKYPAKGHKHFSNWLQRNFPPAVFSSSLPLFLARFVVVSVVFAFYFHMPRGPHCCLPPSSSLLPPILLILRLTLSPGSHHPHHHPHLCAQIFALYCVFPLDSSRFCFVLPFLPTSLGLSLALPLFLSLHCVYLAQRAEMKMFKWKIDWILMNFDYTRTHSHTLHSHAYTYTYTHTMIAFFSGTQIKAK